MIETSTLVRLTGREREVLAQVAKGLRNWQVAQSLCISEATVENHLHRIFVKLEVKTRTEAVMVALRNGDIHP